MAEPSTPSTAGSEQAPQLSVEQRLANVFKAETARAEHKSIPKALAPEQKVEAEAAPAEQTEQAPETDQATAEQPEADLPAAEGEAPEPEQSDGDTWTIVHNGAEVKLNREEVIRHAQQGFDYERKTQAVAEERKQVQAMLQFASALQQVAPQVMQEEAQAQAFASQLKAWENVDWVQLATENPMEYPKYRAQYDQLERNFRQAVDRAQKVRGEFQQAQAWAAQQQLQQEAARLPDIEPDFRKPEALAKVLPEVRAYALKRGVPIEYIAASNNAGLVAVAYDGLRYQKLMASKGVVEKQMRAAAPMAKPAAAQSPTTAVERAYKEDRAQLKKSGSVEDAARLFARLGAGATKK